MNNIIMNQDKTEYKNESKEKEEKKKIIEQISEYQRIIDEAKKKGFRTHVYLPNDQEISECQLDTLRLHLDNFKRVAHSAEFFEKGVSSSQARSSTQLTKRLTKSQKRLLENPRQRMKLIKQKEEKLKEVDKTVAATNLEKATQEEMQKRYAQHPEIPATETTEDDDFGQLDKLGKIIGEGFKEAIKPLSEAINKQGQKIDGLAEKIGEIHKVVSSAAQTEGTSIDDSRDRSNDHGWDKKVIWLLSLIGLLAFSGVLYLLGAFNGVKDIAESAKQLATTVSATASEAKSLAQTAQTSANLALEYNKVQNSRLNELDRQIGLINSKISGILTEIKELSSKVELDRAEIIRLNDELAQLRRAIREYALQFNLQFNDLEIQFGNQIAILDRFLSRFFKIYDFLTMGEGGICIRDLGCFNKNKSQPYQADCLDGLTKTNKGTYLVPVIKLSEQGSAYRAGELVVKLCLQGIRVYWLVLVQFDSVNPNQGQKANYENTCQMIGENIFSCSKVAGYRLRNVRTEINGIETWGNVPAGTIP